MFLVQINKVINTWRDEIFISKYTLLQGTRVNINGSAHKMASLKLGINDILREFCLSIIMSVISTRLIFLNDYRVSIHISYHLGQSMPKKVCWGVCGQRRRRSDCASAQSDQSLRCPLAESLGSIEWYLLKRSKISDHTVRMRGLTLVCAVRICHDGPLSYEHDIWKLFWLKRTVSKRKCVFEHV